MNKITFALDKITWGTNDATPMTAEANVGFHHREQSRCLCGRFCRISEEHGYDGSYNQIWLTYHCSRCGDITESIV